MSNSSRNTTSLSTSFVSKSMQKKPDVTPKSFLQGITGYDGAIDLSSLKKIGGGGTHDIYRSDKYPGLLLKVMRHTAGKDEDELARNLQTHNDQCDVLYETFSPSRCIMENRSIQPIKHLTPNDEIQKAIISIVLVDSCFDGCDLFLMETPENDKFKLSDDKSLFLYQDNDKQTFYKIKIGNEEKIIYLEDKKNKLPSDIKSKMVFDQKGDDPIKCHENSICNIVLNITFDRGHTQVYKEKFGFNVKIIEDNAFLIDSKRYLYQETNKALLGNLAKPSSYVMRNYPLINSNFSNIFKLLDTDTNLAEMMREFLTKYKKFYKKSGILLDTIGLDNVIFYKTNNGWQFKLGSVIKHDTGALTKNMLEEIKKNPSAVKNSPYSTSIYLMPSCIRALNACAEKLGMAKVIDDIVIDENTINALAKIHEQSWEHSPVLRYLKQGKFADALHLFQQYVSEEKKYDTRLRDEMGTHYWEYIKNGGKEKSREEVDTFLNILRDPMRDPKNDFPDFRKKVVREAIEGLNKKIFSIDSKKTASHIAPENIAPHEKKENESDKQFVARLGRLRK